MARSKQVNPVAVALAGAAAAVGGTVALLAPRHDGQIDERWEEMSRHRFAHRGLHDRSQGIPENSLAAFRRARDLGFGAELDVHLTADGMLVVMHDSDLRRMCGRAGIIEDLTLEELGSYRLLDTDERIPTFDEVLTVFEQKPDAPSAPPLIIELKTFDDNAAELCPRVMRTLDAHDVEYAIESFDPRVLIWLRRNRPEVIRGQLAEDFMRDEASAYLGVPLRWALSHLLDDVATRPDFIAYRFEHRDDPAVQLVCGRLGGRLVSWTIRSERDMRVSEAEGAPAIFEGFVPESAVRD